ELEDQNRLLMRLGKRQESHLQRFQDMKSELPHIIEAHKMEIGVLREKLRRMTNSNNSNETKLKQQDTRIIKLTEEVTKLRELCRKRSLPERDALNKKLSETQLHLQNKERDFEEMSHRHGIIEKSLRQQVQSEVAKHRATSKKLYDLQYEHTKVQDTLK
ncbi:unnamed protein product, partial [Meganyctiphanes norvegica]